MLLTGMSGTGKSALVHELRHRGHEAYHADEDGFSEPQLDGRWGWRAEMVAELLARASGRLLFFAGGPRVGGGRDVRPTPAKAGA